MELQWTVDEEGVIRVGGTRVSLDTVVSQLDVGATAEEIVKDLPALKVADVEAVRAFYLKHRPQVEEYLRQRVRVADKVRRMMESLTGTSKLWLPS
jgi:uncharacterized protein (DUF433 family)